MALNPNAAAIEQLANARKRHIRELLSRIEKEQWGFAREQLSRIEATHTAQRILQSPAATYVDP